MCVCVYLNSSIGLSNVTVLHLTNCTVEKREMLLQFTIRDGDAVSSLSILIRYYALK